MHPKVKIEYIENNNQTSPANDVTPSSKSKLEKTELLKLNHKVKLELQRKRDNNLDHNRNEICTSSKSSDSSKSRTTSKSKNYNFEREAGVLIKTQLKAAKRGSKFGAKENAATKYTDAYVDPQERENPSTAFLSQSTDTNDSYIEFLKSQITTLIDEKKSLKEDIKIRDDRISNLMLSERDKERRYHDIKNNVNDKVNKLQNDLKSSADQVKIYKSRADKNLEISATNASLRSNILNSKDECKTTKSKLHSALRRLSSNKIKYESEIKHWRKFVDKKMDVIREFQIDAKEDNRTIKNLNSKLATCEIRNETLLETKKSEIKSMKTGFNEKILDFAKDQNFLLDEIERLQEKVETKCKGKSSCCKCESSKHKPKIETIMKNTLNMIEQVKGVQNVQDFSTFTQRSVEVSIFSKPNSSVTDENEVIQRHIFEVFPFRPKSPIIHGKLTTGKSKTGTSGGSRLKPPPIVKRTFEMGVQVDLTKSSSLPVPAQAAIRNKVNSFNEDQEPYMTPLPAEITSSIKRPKKTIFINRLSPKHKRIKTCSEVASIVPEHEKLKDEIIELSSGDESSDANTYGIPEITTSNKQNGSEKTGGEKVGNSAGKSAGT